MNRNIPFIKSSATFIFFIIFAGLGRLQAQTLVAGDIAFTGYNSSSYGNNFSFVLLRTISSGTQINFTDIGWDPIMSSLHSVSSDGVFTWTSSTMMTQFTEVTIVIGASGTSITSVTATSGSAGTATAPTAGGNGGTGTGMVLSGAGDQILAFTGTQSSPTFIAGIHCNSQTVPVGTSGVSTRAIWDDIQAGGIPYGANVSHIPPGLTTGVNAVMIVDGSFLEYDVAKYNCTGAGTSSSISTLTAAINNVSNWSMSNSTAATLPSGCSFAVTAPPAITGQPSNAGICAGGTATFSVTATGATSYQWQENTGSSLVNITNGGIYSGATGATLTITGATAAMNGYTYRVNVTGTSTVTSNAATLTVTSPGTWLGGSSTAWSNIANWSCGTLPTSSTNVTIPSGTTYSPLVDIATAVANNITIGSGATLAFTGTTNVLDIYGTLSNTGTYNPAGGKTVFAGAAQTIPALTYTSLQMNGAGSKTLAGTVTVSGTLTMTNGYLLLGSNNLTIANTGNISGSNINSFVVINGTGGLIQNNIGAGGRIGTIAFPIGISTTSYTPMYLNNTSGTADNFKVRVINNVYSSYDASDNPTSAALTTKVVGRTWLITEGTAGGSNATVTAQWNGADELSGFDNSNCGLLHYYGSKWHNDAGAPMAAGGFDPYTRSAAGVTNFSPFGVGSTGGPLPLPLRLLSFSGQHTGNDVALNWTTADEKDVHEFILERSEDAVAFMPLNIIAANNSSNHKNTYQFTDKAAGGAAQLYYRLKMLDMDGSYTYSNIISIAGCNKSTATHYVIYPNPISGNKVFIRTANLITGNLNIVICDMAGRKLYQTSIPSSEVNNRPVPLSVKLPAGIYMMQLNDSNITQQVRIEWQ